MLVLFWTKTPKLYDILSTKFSNAYVSDAQTNFCMLTPFFLAKQELAKKIFFHLKARIAMLKYYLSFPIESSCRLWSPNHDHHTSTDVKCPLRASLSSTILPPPREITCQDIGRDIATLCDPTNLFSWLLDKGATVVKSAEFHESFASKKNKAKSSAFTTCFKLIHLAPSTIWYLRNHL